MSAYTFVATSLTETPVSKLSKFQCFILTLMKLRLNSSNYDLAFRFGISESTVGRIFARWIEAMDIRLSFLIAWPDRADLHKTMPFCYRINYGLRITSIIDCFELFIKRPSNLLAKACIHGLNINIIIWLSTLLALLLKEQLVSYQMVGEAGCQISILLKTQDI